MKSLTEVAFAKLMSNPKYNVSPHTHHRVYSGAKLVKRKLDGQIYSVQDWSAYVSIWSVSQLRVMLISFAKSKVRVKAINAELKKRYGAKSTPMGFAPAR